MQAIRAPPRHAWPPGDALKDLKRIVTNKQYWLLEHEVVWCGDGRRREKPSSC